jgi:integrase/recombinase XerD
MPDRCQDGVFDGDQGLEFADASGQAPDVDLGAEVITIRQAKFGRTRLVPLHTSTAEALRAYAVCRDGLHPPAQSGTFFVSDSGAALSQSSVHQIFTQLITGLGLRSDDVRPRMHDLRH